MIFPFDYKKRKRRRRRIIVSIVVACALIAGVSIQEIYHRYFYEQDRLIHFFPSSTVVYVHATLSGSVYGDVQQFLQFHPTLSQYVFGHAASQKLQAVWPALPFLEAEQVSLGIRLENDEYIPQAAMLFSSSEKATAVRQQDSWDGWRAYQDEEVVWFVPAETKQWSDQTLHSYFLQEYLPVSNSWYAFIQKETGLPWLLEHFKSDYIATFVEQSTKGKPYSVLSLAFRDNALIISDSVLALNQTDENLGIEDALESDVLYIAKNVSYDHPVMQYGLTKWALLSPDTSRRPGLATRLELEDQKVKEIVQDNQTSFVYEQGEEDPFVAFKVISDDYGLMVSLFRSLASYDFPKKEQKRLEDGAIITEYMALDHQDIREVVWNQSGYQIMQLQFGDSIWEYALMQGNGTFFITNDNTKITTLSNTVLEGESTCRVGGSYVYHELDHSKKEEIGLDLISVISNLSGTYACFR